MTLAPQDIHDEAKFRAANGVAGTVNGTAPGAVNVSDAEAAGFVSPDDTTPPPPRSHAPGATLWLRTVVGIMVLYLVYCLGQGQKTQSTVPVAQGPFVTDTAPASAGQVLVHVAGRVKHPGLYKLAYNSRVNDAIHQAGGALPDGDIDALNLAAWVDDGSRIEVPSKVKLLPPATAAVTHSTTALAVSPRALAHPVAEQSPPALRVSRKASEVGKTAPGKAAHSRSGKPAAELLAKHPVDVNTAEATELQQLPGVGPVMAAKIIAQRQQYGRFKTVDDLRDVKGIGEKRLDKLRPLVTVK